MLHDARIRSRGVDRGPFAGLELSKLFRMDHFRLGRKTSCARTGVINQPSGPLSRCSNPPPQLPLDDLHAFVKVVTLLELPSYQCDTKTLCWPRCPLQTRTSREIACIFLELLLQEACQVYGPIIKAQRSFSFKTRRSRLRLPNTA
jgi:hypothetical protein